MILHCKVLDDRAILPTRGSKYAAGLDIYAVTDGKVTIMPGERALVSTGLAMKVDEGHFGGIYARSGIACKFSVHPANCVGVVDSDYRGEVKVCLHNSGNLPFSFEHGDRIAQLIIQEYVHAEPVIVEDLEDTDRGEGGFGSTGVSL